LRSPGFACINTAERENMPGQDLIQDIDFGALHREQCRRSSFGARSSADWDRRAARRRGPGSDDDYVRDFLARVDWTGAQTALDIGCGAGQLAIPLARRLRTVHALDFSPAMLRQLEGNRVRAGVENIVAHRLSWADSWQGVPAADIVVCSRAMTAEDLRGALEKMHRKARVRCYLTIHSGGSYLGSDVTDLLDREIVPRPDYIYAVNILHQMGVRARVDFLRSTGGMAYDSADRFVEAVRWRIGALAPQEEKKLRKFFRGLPRDPDGKACYRHDFEWAMLAWEKKR
jgi:SAM-dependent methyltransferase